MTKTFRIQSVLAVAIAMTCAVCFAQSGGEAVYKAKCAMCHGANGVPPAAMGKAMGIKPATDADQKKLTIDQIVAAIKSGKGKMKPVAGLTDQQMKDSAAFYKNLK
jgi:mono/diheme cytochrome c family protein